MLYQLPRGRASIPWTPGCSASIKSRPKSTRDESRRNRHASTTTTTTMLATSPTMALRCSALPLARVPRGSPRSARADSWTLSTPLTTNASTRRTFMGRIATRSTITAAAADAADSSSSSSPSPSSPRLLTQQAEASRYCYEDLVLFLLSVDCDVQLNRALAKDDFELAAAVRDRRAQIDEALEALRSARDLLPTRGDRSSSSSSSAAPSTSAPSSSAAATSEIDAALQGVRLRSELASAIEAEDYALASELRDRIKGVEEQLAAAAGAAALRAERAGAPPRLRLGARVLHSELGYRGAIAGWDACCLETPEWQAAAGISSSSSSGSESEEDATAFQPFYHVLVDARDWEGPEGSPPLLYVPQSRLSWPAREGANSDDECWLTWPEVELALQRRKASSGSSNASFLYEGVDACELLHPYSYLLFLGTDERGDMIPTKALRERYGAPRVDVYPPGEERGGEEGGATQRGEGGSEDDD